MSMTVLERRALVLRQPPDHEVFVFALRADEIRRVAGISRLQRNPDGALDGFQRDEIRRHIQDIREYLDGAQVLFPNALVLAFDAPVKFTSSRGPRTDDGLARAGTLEIPLPAEGQSPAAWIVDGQQRSLALREAARGDLPVWVVAFVAPSHGVMRDQFLRLNNARPLPKALITELLPETDTLLPRWMAARKLPAAICEALSISPDSPFRDLVKRPSNRNSKGIITDTALVEMIRERLKESGCLFPYRDDATGETDTEGILRLLISYWSAVRDVFPDAWGKPPGKSRLMHGTGIRVMGHLLDTIAPRVDAEAPDAGSRFAREIERVAPICRWTDGIWEGIGLPWDAVENTPKSVRLLSNLLVREYVRRVRG
jgi:DGQHR domain-containing protein